MSDSRFGYDPYDMGPDDFESDVFRAVDSWYDDLGLEVQVELGDTGGMFVEITDIRDSAGVTVAGFEGSALFYSVDDFRAFVERFTPEDY